MPSAHQRQRGQEARHGGEAVEEVVLRAEHDRRPQDDGVGIDFAHRRLGAGLGAAVDRVRRVVGADGRHLDEAPHARLPRRLRHGAGAIDVHGLEGLVAGLGQDADEVHRHLGVAQGRGERGRVAHVGLDGMDLPHAAERLEVVGEVRAAATGHDAEPGPGEGTHDVAPQESGGAEDGHLPIGREIGSGHHALHERWCDV